MLQGVAGCCRVLQGVAGVLAYVIRATSCSSPLVAQVCRAVLQCVAVCCRRLFTCICDISQLPTRGPSLLQCVAGCCSVLQCIEMCCNILQCGAVYIYICRMLHCVTGVSPLVAQVCCIVLQRVLTLQSVAVWCSML